MQTTKNFVNSILSKKIGPAAFSGTFLAIIAIRVFIEQFIAKSNPISYFEIMIEYLHNLYFFLISFIILWLILGRILKCNLSKLAYAMMLGSILIIFPPIFDMAKTGGEVYWSFYILSAISDIPRYFFTFFGNLPSGILYFGTKIVFILAILFFSAFVYLASRNFFKTLLAFLGSYIVLFIMGIFPSIFYYFYRIPAGLNEIFAIKNFNIAQFFGASHKILGLPAQSINYTFPYTLDIIYFPLLVLVSAVLFYAIDKNKFWAILKNARYPQSIIHSGLFLMGAGLGYLNYPQNFNLNIFSISAGLTLLISIWLAWLASVIINDIYDFNIDGVSNADRPLQKKIFTQEQYWQLGIVLFLLSFIGALSVGFHFAVLILAYQIIAWFYSAEPLRFKKFPGVATFLSSLALIIILFSGYILMSPDQSISGLNWRIIFLLVIAYTLALPLKDFKDIAGDGKYRIWTIPVIFGESRARTIVAVSIFISFILPVFFLNEFKLFWPAIIFGTAGFLVVTSKKIGPRLILWPVIGLVVCYGIVLVKVLFL